MNFFAKTLCLASFLACTLPAHAFVVGSATPSAGNCYPFGCRASDWNPEYQQVYAASQFASKLKITSLTFYNTRYDSGNYSLNAGTYQLYLSTTTKAVNGLDSAMSNNIGTNDTLVFSGTLPAGSVNAFGADFDFNLSSSFDYDPNAGNLLLRVISSNSNNGNIYLDMDTSGEVMSRMYRGGSGSVTQWSLVTGFNEATVPVPEPASLALISLALVGLATSRPRNRRQTPQ